MTRFRGLRPSIPLLVLISNLALILLPITGVTALRLYESALVRQTENALISQAAFVSALVRERLASEENLSVKRPSDDKRWRPRFANLDLSRDDIAPLPQRPQAPSAATDARVIAIKSSVLPVLYDAQNTTLSAIRVLDAKGNIAISTGEDTGLSLAHWPLYLKAQEGERTSELKRREPPVPAPPLASISRTSRIRVYYAEPVVLEGVVRAIVMVWRTPPNILQTLWGKRYELVFALFLLVAALSALTFSVVVAIRNPLRRLEKMAAKVAKGQTQSMTPLEHPRTREVANLSNSINAMAQKLDHRATYVRDLAARISHEFKSPITSINGAAELLAEYGPDMPADQHAQFVTNIAADGERMNRLVSRLMELAEADFRVADSERTVPLENLLAKWHSEHEELVVWAVADACHDLIVPRESITSIVVNLIDNALAHGAADEPVAVTLDFENGRLIGSVENRGEIIKPEILERMFEPFFTTNRDNGGTGLGLAVARAAVETLSGKMSATSENGLTRFDFAVLLP